MIYYISADGVNAPWVAEELRHLRKLGIPWTLTQLRKPRHDYFGSDWATAILQETRTLYPIRPTALLTSACLAVFLFRGRFLRALINAVFGRRENLRVRVAAFFHLWVAAHWARQIRHEEVDLIHSQWIHACGTVGMYAAWLLDVPFSFTGHAVDLFAEPCALEDKVRRADFIVCISAFHRDFYQSLGASPDKLHIVYCGIETDGVPTRPPPESERARVVTFGRLVEKKGLDVLIDAFALLAQRRVPVDCLIQGTGPCLDALRDQIREKDVADTVTLEAKILPKEAMNDFILDGHIFAQPCVVAANGDMDGIPRTLMEAMICGRPVISTDVAGIPDLIEHGVTGLLTPQRDALALADAIELLVTDPGLAQRIAQAGRDHVIESFKLPECLAPLAALFRARLRPS